MPETKPTLQELGDIISGYLEKIETLFINPKITLVVRAPNLPDGDLIMTLDDLDLVIAAIQRLKDRPSSSPES